MISEKEYERQFKILYPWSWCKNTEHNTHRKTETDVDKKNEKIRIGGKK